MNRKERKNNFIKIFAKFTNKKEARETQNRLYSNKQQQI